MTYPKQPEPWTYDALCTQTDPELWYPLKNNKIITKQAKTICQQCPAQQQCLQHAIQNDEPFGIWGGLSTTERHKLRYRKQRP